MTDGPERIRDALARLQDRLHLDAIDQTAVIRWDIVTLDVTLSFGLAADEGRWLFSEGVPDDSRLAVALAVDELLGLAGGSLAAGPAFLTGRLRLSGDLALAQTILPGFDQAVTAAPPDPIEP
jgi:hypothetical protein